MAVKGTVRGDREIIANIRRAYNSVGGRALDQNLSSALVPMKDETIANARSLRDFAGKHPGWPPPSNPRKGGHLDQGVVIAKYKAVGPLYREYWVSLTKRARKIGHLVEFGTAPHAQPNLGIMHPGARPHPFFRPAFESTKDEAVAIVGRNVWSRISASIVGTFKR